MSDETKAAFESALQAHIADEWPEHQGATNIIVNAYVCKVHVIDLDESADAPESRYFFVKPDRQEYHATYGLLLTAQDDFVTASASDDD